MARAVGVGVNEEMNIEIMMRGLENSALLADSKLLLKSI